MLELALLLAAAAAAHAVARWTKLPAVPLLVLAGGLLSLGGAVSGPGIQEILVLSLTVLLFAAGTSLEMSPAGRSRSVALQVGALQFAVLGGLGMGAAVLLGYRTGEALHLAVALAASSTLLGVRILQRRRQLFEPHGRLVLGVLLLQDFAVVLLLPVLTRWNAGARSLLASLVATVALAGAAWLVRERVAPRLLERLDLDSETWLLVFLTVLFGFVGAAGIMGVPAVTAAFLAGFSLSRFPVGAVARGQLSSLTDFFSALFFTALGTWVVVPGVRELIHAGLLAAVVVVVTPPLVAIAAERGGFTARAGVLSGLVLAQTSEFSLVVALQGVAAGVLDPGVLTVVALTTVLTMGVTPLLATDPVAWALVRRHPMARPLHAPDTGAGHVLLLGSGSNGRRVLDLLLTEGVDAAVVDEDPAVVATLRAAGIPVVRGDAGDVTVLEAAGVTRARVVVSTLRRVEDNEAVLATARDAPVLIRTFEEADEAWVRSRGGIPVSFSEATADDLVAWLEESGPGPTGPAEAADG